MQTKSDAAPARHIVFVIRCLKWGQGGGEISGGQGHLSPFSKPPPFPPGVAPMTGALDIPEGEGQGSRVPQHIDLEAIVGISWGKFFNLFSFGPLGSPISELDWSSDCHVRALSREPLSPTPPPRYGDV